MRLRLFLFAISAIAFFPSLAAHASVAEICNDGNVELNVARAVYSKSFFFGNSYQVSGWYQVQPHKCESIYSSSDPEDLYLGFTYRDPRNILRTYISEPSDNAGPIKAISEKFCVEVGRAFDYKTGTKGSTDCQNGFTQLEFSLFVGASDGDYGRVTYTMRPDRLDPTNSAFAQPTRSARMMYGGEVQLMGKTWQTPGGTPIAVNLIDPDTGLPPLGPKTQYSSARAPVAGAIKQINDALAAFRSCDESSNTTLSQTFGVDDRGVAMSMYTGSESGKLGMAIASLDLAGANVSDRGGCWEIEIRCKNGNFCMQVGDFPSGAAKSTLYLWVKTNDHANTILANLKAIAPYYPDATPDIRFLN